MYQPVIVRQEIDSEHFYFVDGVFFPGVTTILTETLPTPDNLRFWIGDVGNDRAQAKLERAAARGTLIHEACERLLQGGEVQLHREFPTRGDQKCVVGFINWVNSSQPEILGIETVVASQDGFAGTLDIVCRIDGQLWIIDIKTSGGIYINHKLQIAAYRQAWYEMTGEWAAMGILHLTPKAKNGYTFHTDLDIGGKPVSTDDFRKVFELYKVLNGGKIPEPPEVNIYPERLKLYGEEST